ncbi:hypothetical protein [Altererythrobacter sp. TH136]|uniref:hypothetical protein n=1 Tax=Altererythrobacter sp. TH136 TaxID=2067415 RepID=UPI0011642956|nr:hypothetical protein [Altererythrobacter sp. TH136]QDM39741.1 hypothetical protein C0V74_00760 [Altererythrobacter sp. TH136]
MFFRTASVAALAASVSMIAAPVGATSLPKPSSSAAVHGGGFDANSVNAEAHRRWRHRDRVDAGDVIAGVAVIGVIAAIAGAANQSSRNSDYRYPQRYPYPDRAPNYRTDGAGYRYGESGGLDRAADMCAREVERSGPVDAVESVNRTGSGWQVSGRLRDGARFNCSIGNDGRIEGVNIDRYGAAGGGQWDDERYAAARQAQGDPGVAEYPGGPIGNEASDDRYDAGQVPDYPG